MYQAWELGGVGEWDYDGICMWIFLVWFKGIVCGSSANESADAQCEDLSMGHPLLPLGDPQLRAHCRMWADHVRSFSSDPLPASTLLNFFWAFQINRKIIPPFDLLLTTPSTDPSKQSSLTTTLQSAITDLVNASHVTGPFFLGATISFIDVMFAPWIIRLSRVLKYYRRWPDPEVGTRWETWVQAVEGDERVRRTVSEEGEYQRVYKRRASQGVMTMPGGVGWALADGMVPDSGADCDGVMGT